MENAKSKAKGDERLGFDIIIHALRSPTRQIAEKQMKDLTDEQVYKIVRGNAIKLYDLDLK